MEIKKLQKKIDKALAILSDHDDKKHEDRYKNLRNFVEEAQDYIDKENYSSDISLELYNCLTKGIKKFESERLVFLIFLIILCGIFFIGIFSITYSHFGGTWPPFWPWGPSEPSYPVNPPNPITPPSTSKTTTKTTTKVDGTTSSTTTTNKTTSSTTKTTTSQVVEPDPTGGMVTVIFDTSSLIDLNNLIPVDDNIGLISTPTKWSLSSSLTGASRNYTVTYTIDFIDELSEIAESDLLDIKKLKYQLLIKKKGTIIYNSGVQLMKDYPEIGEGIRPIITTDIDGSTFKNNETLDFELRMWLDSTTGNDQQGKKYKFKIAVDATYDFD